MIRKELLIIALLFVAVSTYSQMVSNIPPDKPKLVVGIVVEQMRQDYLDRFWGKFGDRGFKKIANHGTYFQNAELNYSLTQTSSGFATIATGAEPSAHGIVSDLWYNPLTGDRESAIIKNNYKPVGTKSDIPSYSPENLLSSVFSDEVKLFTKQQSKVISLGICPIGSVISGGFTANASYWLDEETGHWISNTYYLEKLPEWVKKFNKRDSKDRFIERKWTPLLSLEEYDVVLPDSNIYEFGFYGMFKTFPYNYQEITKYIRNYELLKMIPEGNTLTTDFAIAALFNENLGRNQKTDFLFVNYSVTENIGNLFGPQSVELMDTYLRLDQDIAHLVSVLEDRLGKNNFILYLTSNCGVSEVPQYLIDNKMPAGYFRQHYIKALLESYLRAIYGEGDWILDFGNNQIYLNRTLIEDSQINLADFQNSVANFILNSRGIAYAKSSSNMQNNVFMEGIPKKMQNSYNAQRSGDIMISLSPGWIEDMTNVVAHNSGYTYDTHVPLIWYGWKVKRQKIYKEVNITNIAPTISMILKKPRPPVASGNVMPYIFLNK